MSQQHTQQTPQRHATSTTSQEETTEQVEIGPLLVANRFFIQPIGNDEASHEAETLMLSALQDAATAEATASPSTRSAPRQLPDLNLTPAQQVAHGMQVFDLHVAANLVSGLVDSAHAEMFERSDRRMDAEEVRERQLAAVAQQQQQQQQQQQETPFVVPSADLGWNVFDPQLSFINDPVLLDDLLDPADYGGAVGILDPDVEIWLQQADVCPLGEGTVSLSLPFAQIWTAMPTSADVGGYGGGQLGSYGPFDGSHVLREGVVQQPGRQEQNHSGAQSQRARLPGMGQSASPGGLQGSCAAPGRVRR